MKKDIAALFFIMVISAIAYNLSFTNFFAQDDFILITEFSQNDLTQDLVNSFGEPGVTHWRPIHNLYFLVSGNLFDKNYVGFHFLTFLFHAAGSFLIYIISKNFLRNNFAALGSSLIYATHPAHFVSLFWISGAATIIGFFFLLFSLHLYIKKKLSSSLFLYTVSLLASEAMIVGVLIFLSLTILKEKAHFEKRFILSILAVSFLFLFLKFTFFIPETTFETYKFGVSWETFVNIKYYISRILGFAEVSQDLAIAISLLGWLLILSFIFIKSFKKITNFNLSLFSILLIVFGLFPFILLVDHRSPHYMNISIWGFALTIGVIVNEVKLRFKFLLILFFLIASIINVNKLHKNNWVIEKSNIAKRYLMEIEKANLNQNSMLVFNNNNISSSFDAYIALGTGKAIDFYFRDKDYNYCFSEFEDCSSMK